MSLLPYRHRMGAHCESGTVANLLNHAGLEISEPMVFGIAGGIFFGYFSTPWLPFPSFVLRNQPGKMRTNLARRLGVRWREERFGDADRAMAALDAWLERGVPVALQADYFHMTYLPEYTRAHFNAHFVVAVGKEGDRYLLSDAYHPTIGSLDAATLRTARFGKGQFAPRGLLFRPERIPERPEWRSAIRAGIRQAAFYMLRIPLPFLGVRGIRRFAERVVEWPRLARDEEHLSHEIMMIHVILEERGTGGGGFRFLYAAFLQEAARLTGNAELADLSGLMVANGDRWREISLFVARVGRSRDLGPAVLGELARLIGERAVEEERLFRRLYEVSGRPL